MSKPSPTTRALYDALRECMLHLPDFADDDQPAIRKAVTMARAAMERFENEPSQVAQMWATEGEWGFTPISLVGAEAL